ERPLVRRLRRLALREQLGDVRLDLRLGTRMQPEADLCDDLARREARMAIRELELVRSRRTWAAGVDDDGVDHDRAPVAPVRAGVHPDAAARGARNRRRELEAAEAGRTRAMETDGVGRAAARDEQL